MLWGRSGGGSQWGEAAGLSRPHAVGMSLSGPAVDAEGTLGRRTFAASWEEAGGPAAGLLLAAQARVQAARQADDEPALCAALREEGRQLLSAGQPQAALGVLFEAVALYDPAALEEQARVWQLAARAQLALAAEAEAREYLGLGLRLMQQAGHLSGAIDLLEDLAELEAGSGDQLRALAHLEAHLGLRRELGEPLGLCQTLLAVGKARLRQSPPQTGEPSAIWSAAAHLAREIGSAALLAQAQGHLAAAHGLRGELDEAEALLQRKCGGLCAPRGRGPPGAGAAGPGARSGRRGARCSAPWTAPQRPSA